MTIMITIQSVTSFPVEEIDRMPLDDDESVDSLYTTSGENNHNNHQDDTTTMTPLKPCKRRHKTPYPSKGILTNDGALELSPKDNDDPNAWSHQALVTQPTALLTPSTTDSSSSVSFFEHLRRSDGVGADSGDDVPESLPLEDHDPQVSPHDFFVPTARVEPVQKKNRPSPPLLSSSSLRQGNHVDSPVPYATRGMWRLGDGILTTPSEYRGDALATPAMMQDDTPIVSNVTPMPSKSSPESVYYTAAEDSPLTSDTVEL